jgi:hypothetical protein
MGYRSQITFVVEKPLVSSLLTLFATNPTVREMLTCDNPIEKTPMATCCFRLIGLNGMTTSMTCKP